MFVSGTAQQRTLRSTRSGSTVLQKQFTRVDTNPAKRRRTIASIGDPEASGLVIQGSHELDDNEDNLKDFNIQFSGAGVPRFSMPIRIPGIDGNVSIEGDVNVSGNVNSLNLQPIEEGEFGDQIEIGKDNVTGFNTAFSIGTYWKQGNIVHLYMDISWNSKGSVLDTDSIVITGLPFTQDPGTMELLQIFTPSVNLTEIGSSIFGTINSSTVHLFRTSPHLNLDTPLTGALFNATGNIVLQGYYITEKFN